MNLSHQNGLGNVQEELTKITPFGDPVQLIDELKGSILRQLRALENTKQFPYLENIICSKDFDEFGCLVNDWQLAKQNIYTDFHILIISSGYYNSFLGKAIDHLNIKIHLIDSATEGLIETLTYPTF